LQGEEGGGEREREREREREPELEYAPQLGCIVSVHERTFL